jgi:hypothetical protein
VGVVVVSTRGVDIVSPVEAVSVEDSIVIGMKVGVGEKVKVGGGMRVSVAVAPDVAVGAAVLNMNSAAEGTFGVGVGYIPHNDGV